MVARAGQETQRAEAEASGMGGQKGRLIIRDDVVAKIAGMAAQEVEGISMGGGGLMQTVTGAARGGDSDVKRGIKVEVGERQAAFDLSLMVDYGYNIPDIIAQVRRKITERVRSMTGLETTEINVEVVDINLPGQGEKERSESRVQ